MKRTGIRAKTDPRMRPVVAAMEKFKPKPNASLESLTLVSLRKTLVQNNKK